MGVPRLTILSEQEIEQIHATALQILAGIGVVMQDESALELLRKGGARVDGASGRVFFPEPLVEQAVQVAPKHFGLSDRQGRNFALPSDKSHYHVSGAHTLRVLDHGSQQPRAPRLEDVDRFTKLADALPLIAAVSPQVSNVSGYEDPLEAEIRTYQTMVCNTTKLCLAAPLNRCLAEVWADVGDILADSLSGPARQPVIMSFVSSNAPLQWESESLRALLLNARRAMPTIIWPGGHCGMSAPITLAGSLALKTAEVLSGLVVAQLARPGLPIVFGAVGLTILDMRTADMASAGPEYVIGTIAGAQMARFYDLPSYATAAHTDAKGPDEQAGMEKMACVLSAILAGVDMSVNAGSLNKTTVSSCEQMLIDHEMLRYVYRCGAGIAVDAERLAYDAIERVGPGGTFLTDPHTQRFLRSGENVYLTLFDRYSVNPETAELTTRAHQEAEAILARHTPRVSPQTIQDVDRYVREQLDRLRARSQGPRS